jgi:hypothetical protein
MLWSAKTVATKKAGLHRKRELTPILRLPQEQPGYSCLYLDLYRGRPSGVRLSPPIAARRYRPCSIFRYRGRHTPALEESY